MLILAIQMLFSIVFFIAIVTVFHKILPTEEKIQREIKETRDVINYGTQVEKDELFDKLYKYGGDFFEDEWETFTAYEYFETKTKKEVETDFKKYVKNKFFSLPLPKIEKIIEKCINFRYESFFNKIAFFSCIAIVINMIYFLMTLFQLIQLFIMRSFKGGVYFIVTTPIVWFFPVFILSMSLSSVFFYLFFRKEVTEEKVGKNLYRRLSLIIKDSKLSDTKSSPIGNKIILVFLMLTFVIFFVIMLCFANHFAVVTNEGIYANPWFSFEYDFFSWNDVENIYQVIGYTTKISREFEIDVNPDYAIVMKDGTKILLSNEFSVCGLTLHGYQYQFEKFDRQDEMVFFIENRTGLKMVKGIENEKTGIIYPTSSV